MAHFKGDVIQTRNELLRLLTKQRDIYGGAIAALNKMIKEMEEATLKWEQTIKQMDNTKSMLLMVGVDGPTLELTEEVLPAA